MRMQSSWLVRYDMARTMTALRGRPQRRRETQAALTWCRSQILACHTGARLLASDGGGTMA